MPTNITLKDVAQFYLERLPREQREQLDETVRLVAAENRPLRVGTACSGTDSPVAVFAALGKAIPSLKIQHVFSCEFEARKRMWITQNFPQLPVLFGDIQDLSKGRAWNYVTEKEVQVPSVDILIAGFVCKSVSFENNMREQYANCIKEASGLTGETFQGLIQYVAKYQPAVVICENVEGLTKRNRGAEPVINHVRGEFNSRGYAFEHKVLNSQHYLLPHRRNRCWMWAFLGLQHQDSATLAGEDVVALGQQKFWSMSSLFRSVRAKDDLSRPLVPREREVLSNVQSRLTRDQLKKDLVVDVGKSLERLHYCLGGAAPCVVPNSRTYRVKQNKVLSPEQCHAVQGIFKSDFPALATWAKNKKTIMRDLAGNAFSTTVCMAVFLVVLCNGPLPRASSLKRMTPSVGGEEEEEQGLATPSTPLTKASRGPKRRKAAAGSPLELSARGAEEQPAPKCRKAAAGSPKRRKAAATGAPLGSTWAMAALFANE